MREIAEIKSVMELLQAATQASQQVTDRWIYAAFADHLLLEKWEPGEDLTEKIIKNKDRLLEVRLFWADAEYKAFRGSIGGNFYFRIKDEDVSADYYDERQFLDGDMGRLQVRNYVSYYEESGQAYVSDWRMMAWEGRKDGSE